MERQHGAIKTYNPDRGFGFITTDSGADVFFHITDIPGRQDPVKGQGVTFELVEGTRGPKASRIWPDLEGYKPAA